MDDALDEYLAARKRALRVYNRKVASGQPGTLPYLDSLLIDVEIVAKESLGVIDLPLKKVVGTVTAGRSSSFAENFMPLLRSETEFANKWMTLYKHHQKEGIRDPIKAYEYLNWFYVVEGNKRVSVLKYVDAVSVRADVTRLVPKYDENNEFIRQYYEFLEFYKETKMLDVWINTPGGFRKLSNLLKTFRVPELYKDKPKGYFIDQIYSPFSRILRDLGGDKLSLSTGDVFLRYFDIYKLHQNMDEEIVRPRLKALVEELKSNADEGVDFNTKPVETPEPSLISTLFGIGRPRSQVKIAFAYSGRLADSNWAKSHENGRKHIEEIFSGDIETTYADDVNEDLSAYKVFSQFIADGYTVIFATSPAFAKAALRTALEHPQVSIYLCSEEQPFTHVPTYFGRIYEPRFLTGIIAGSLTRADRIGYVGSYPIRGVISGINAFALGVRTVNPRAQVLVSWAYEWDFSKANTHCTSALVERGADLICHQNTFTGVGFAGEYGLFSVHDDSRPDEYIATPVWNWGAFYERMVRRILSGTARNTEDGRPMQFWWGMDSGMVDILYAKKHVPTETHKLVQLFKHLMQDNGFNPFNGPIFDQTGEERIPAGAEANSQQILSMDWFVEGIDGVIPPLPEEDDDFLVKSGLLEL